MDPKPFRATAPALPSTTALGPVTIRVADLERSIRFYEKVIGLTSARPAGGQASLGVENEPPLVLLKETPGARHLPRNSGLYHFAILLPTRADLGGEPIVVDREREALPDDVLCRESNVVPYLQLDGLLQFPDPDLWAGEVD